MYKTSCAFIYTIYVYRVKKFLYTLYPTKLKDFTRMIIGG